MKKDDHEDRAMSTTKGNMLMMRLKAPTTKEIKRLASRKKKPELGKKLKTLAKSNTKGSIIGQSKITLYLTNTNDTESKRLQFKQAKYKFEPKTKEHMDQDARNQPRG